jgi:AcrR family transcriptional regulator
VAKELGISRTTLYEYLGKKGASGKEQPEDCEAVVG